MIDTSTDTVIGTHTINAALAPGVGVFVLDMEVSVDGTRLYVVASSDETNPVTYRAYIFDVSSPGTPGFIKSLTLGTPDLGSLSSGIGDVKAPLLDPLHYYLIGPNGWKKMTTATDTVVQTVDFGTQRVFSPAMSPDGSMIFGQFASSVNGDTAYAIDVATGTILPNSYTFGDAGGGMHYTIVNGQPRVLLFVGDSAIEGQQRVLVFEPTATGLTFIQEVLNGGQRIKGPSYGVESTDGDAVVISQNRNQSGGGQNSGLSIVRLEKDAAANWQQTDVLELNPTQGQVDRITSTPSLGKYYLANRVTNQVEVVSDGAPAPTPTNIVANLAKTRLSTSYDPQPAPDAPAGVFTIEATFANISADEISGLFFETVILTGGNLVLNCDGGAAGVGCDVLVPASALGPDSKLSPGESFRVEFQIGLQTTDPFDFFVDAWGVVDPI